jgi:hypothetical protein
MTPSLSHVRFASESGHARFVTACPLSANRVLMHRSKRHLYSITSSARATIGADHERACA